MGLANDEVEEDDMGGIEPANDPVLLFAGLLPSRSKPPALPPLGFAGAAPNPEKLLLLLLVLLARVGGRTEAMVGL